MGNVQEYQVSTLITMIAYLSGPVRTGSRKVLHNSSSHILTVRAYSGPLKTYSVFKNPLSVLWARSVPNATKYFSGILATAWGLTHIHPNSIITVGPPALIAGYYIFRRREHAKYLDLVNLVKPVDDKWDDNKWNIRLNKYNEADIDNVLAGIENEFQHFTTQAIGAAERKIVDYAVENAGSENSATCQLLDENNQVLVHLDNLPETFVKLKADVSSDKDEFVEFVKMTVPYYNSKDLTHRKRLGVAEISMLQVPGGEEEKHSDYRLGIRLWPYKFFLKGEVVEPVVGLEMAEETPQTE